jgi:hypothetical protein
MIIAFELYDASHCKSTWDPGHQVGQQRNKHSSQGIAAPGPTNCLARKRSRAPL